jgi:hypothetical protein
LKDFPRPLWIWGSISKDFSSSLWSLKKQAEVLPWVTLAALESEEMARGCSHCGHNGHNSRTCPDRGVRLFGVRLTDGVMRKSVSMSNLSHYASVVANPPSPPEHSGSGATPDGYVSDGLVQTSNNARERKKGMYADFFFFFSPCIS